MSRSGSTSGCGSSKGASPRSSLGMAEPDNLILALLRELRAELDRQDKVRRALEARFDNLGRRSTASRFSAATQQPKWRGVSNRSRSGSPLWKWAVERKRRREEGRGQHTPHRA